MTIYHESPAPPDKDCLRCVVFLLQTYRPTSLTECLRLTALAERIYATFPWNDFER